MCWLTDDVVLVPVVGVNCRRVAIPLYAPLDAYAPAIEPFFMSMLRSIWSGQSPTRPVKVMKWTMNTCSGNGGPKSRNSGLKLSACLVPVTVPHTVCSAPTCPAASDGFKADATASAVAASAAGSRVGVGSGAGRCRPTLGIVAASPAVGSPSLVNPHPMVKTSSHVAAAIPQPGIPPRFVLASSIRLTCVNLGLRHVLAHHLSPCENVSVYSPQQVFLGRVRAEIDVRVQRVQLEEILADDPVFCRSTLASLARSTGGGQGPDQPTSSSLLIPCLASGPTDGASGPPGTASGSCLLSAGMPHSTQCAHRAPGCWLLSTTNARLTVPSGGSDQDMGGDMSSSVQLYFLGMRLILLNFVLVTLMLSSNCWASS